MKFSLFSKKKPSPDTENPYTNARRSWNIYTGSAMQYGSIGILFGIICLLIVLGCVGGIIHIGSQSKFIPLVYKEDSSGNVISMTQADHMPPAEAVDFRSAVGDFINNIRIVTPDRQLQRNAIWRAYAFLSPNSSAIQKANGFLNDKPEDNPFNRASHETVSVQIKSLLQQSDHTWQVDWTETVRGRDGSLVTQPYNMRALITLSQNPNVNLKDQQLFWNPHKIFITDFNWSKQF